MNTQQAIDEHHKQMEEMKPRIADGPWMHEPHRVQWEHAGFTCLLVRGPMFAWCGYVGVPPEHPDYGKNYNDCRASVHGGLTYSNECRDAICHVTEGEDHLHWFGFDCGHLGDLVPLAVPTPENKGLMSMLADGDYRDMAYAGRQTQYLAEQLAEIAGVQHG